MKTKVENKKIITKTKTIKLKRSKNKNLNNIVNFSKLLEDSIKTPII